MELAGGDGAGDGILRVGSYKGMARRCAGDRAFPKPGFEGQRKALLPTIPDRIRNGHVRRLAKGSFSRTRPAKAGRDQGRRPQQFEIDQRRSDLERVAHAGGIGVPEQLYLQVLSNLEGGNAFLGWNRIEREALREGLARFTSIDGSGDFWSE